MRDLVAWTSAIVQNARRRIGVAPQHFHRLIRERGAHPLAQHFLATRPNGGRAVLAPTCIINTAPASEVSASSSPDQPLHDGAFWLAPLPGCYYQQRSRYSAGVRRVIVSLHKALPERAKRPRSRMGIVLALRGGTKRVAKGRGRTVKA
jgi:hypothetical protein